MNKLFLAIFFLILIGCQQSVEFSDIERRNGLYINVTTNNPLDGKYKTMTSIGGTYNGNHVSTFEFDKGIPNGEWTYTFNGDPIHSGKYLVQNQLKSEINSLTNSIRTDIDLWEEGGYWMLNIELISPQKRDSVLLKNIVKITNEAILEKYHYRTVDVFDVSDSTNEKVYWEKVK